MGFDAAPWAARWQARDASDLATAERLIGELEHHLGGLAAAPAQAAGGWRLLGDWQLSAKMHRQAETAFRHALRAGATDARTHEGLGLALLHQHRLEEAWQQLERAHRLEPLNAELLVHWGLVDLEAGNFSAAAERFRKAIEREPRNPHAWHNLGLAAMRSGDLGLCVGHLERCVELDPRHGLGWSNLATVLRLTNRLDDALAAARRAVALKGERDARVWVVLGDLLGDDGDFESALSHARRAQALEPGHAGARILEAKVLSATASYEEAEVVYRRLLQDEPENVEARGGLGQLLLLLHRWDEGWPLYEARRQVAFTPVRALPLPAWQGHEDLRGQRLLVHAEQGLGDILLFATCLPDLARSGATISVEVPLRLEALMRRSFPGLQVIGHEPTDRDHRWLGSPPAHDFELAIGSLPLHFRRSAPSFERAAAHLRADATARAGWRQRSLGARGGRLIGLSWRGGLAQTAARQRSISLARLLEEVQRWAGAQRAAGSPVGLLLLQHGDTTQEVAALAPPLMEGVVSGPDGFGDLDDVAAATAACDAVLTICSTQAHLTGGLGVPGIVLVPANPNWRYGAQGERSPWYGSLHLVRQTTPDDWAAALAAAMIELDRVLEPSAGGAPVAKAAPPA